MESTCARKICTEICNFSLVFKETHASVDVKCTQFDPNLKNNHVKLSITSINHKLIFKAKEIFAIIVKTLLIKIKIKEQS